MDFSAINAKIEETFWVQPEIEGSPLFWDDEKKSLSFDAEGNVPVRIEMRSARSNEVASIFRKYTLAQSSHQARLAKLVIGDVEREVLAHNEKIEGIVEKMICAAVVGWENVYFDQEPATFSTNRLLEIIDTNRGYSQKAIRSFLLEKILEGQGNFKDAAKA